MTIRKLKENGVECYFEKEGIYTFDGKGELLITIMSSLAQEESRSISENITWGQRKSFADGKVHLAYKHFLGYEKGEDGRPAIVEEEAAIVRLIYRLFLDGKVEPDEWDHVQAEFARRKELGNAYSGKSVLSAKLVCEDCELMRKKLTDFKSLDADIERQLEETQIVAELVKAAVKENATTAQSQKAYLEKYEALTQRYETEAAELARLQNLRTLSSQKDKAMALYILTLKKQPTVLSEWNDTIWTVMVEKATVHRNGEITFVFYNGTKVRVEE